MVPDLESENSVLNSSSTSESVCNYNYSPEYVHTEKESDNSRINIFTRLYVTNYIGKRGQIPNR